jgi:acetolactate synthase-1/2/3 large subunit
MKVYEALAGAFAAEGVTDVFGMMGDGNLHWIDALDRRGVRTIETRHENAALSMAQAYSRVTGGVGVCTTTNGPGVTQLATSMIIASRSNAPVVIFSGETPAGDDEHIQRIDPSRFAEANECAFVRVHSPAAVGDTVQKAFYIARSQSRPVLLSAPNEVQRSVIEDDLAEDYVPSTKVFRPSRTVPDPEILAQAVDLIAASKRPVVLVGRGAAAAGAAEPVLRLADRIGAVVATSLLAKNWLNNYPYHVGISGTYGTRTSLELFQEVDCVIAVGASLNKYTTGAGYLYPLARVIQVDVRPHVRLGGGSAADIYLQGDAYLTVSQLCDELERRGHSAPGFHTPDLITRLSHAFEDPERFDIQPGTVDPREVCRTLDTTLPEHVGVVLGSGQSVGFSTMLFNRARELMLPNQIFGSIGQGMSAALGAIVGSKGRPCVLMEGDVSFMMYLPEFETAVRYGLPLLAVVMNDQAMGAELHRLRSQQLNYNLARLGTPDLGAVAVALGGRGTLAREIDDVRRAAAEFVERPGPMVIDVRIAPEVVTIPYRRLYYGQDV